MHAVNVHIHRKILKILNDFVWENRTKSLCKSGGFCITHVQVCLLISIVVLYNYTNEQAFILPFLQIIINYIVNYTPAKMHALHQSWCQVCLEKFSDPDTAVWNHTWMWYKMFIERTFLGVDVINWYLKDTSTIILRHVLSNASRYHRVFLALVNPLVTLQIDSTTIHSRLFWHLLAKKCQVSAS